MTGRTRYTDAPTFSRPLRTTSASPSFASRLNARYTLRALSQARRALFAIGRARGLDIDDLRELTPTGSISVLTRVQASHLLDGLNAGTQYAHPRKSVRSKRRPKGVHRIATEAQRRKIEALRIDLGWSPQGLRGWLSERHHDDGRPLTSIDSTRDAQAVIELLKVVLSRSLAASRHHGEEDGT